jgi:hypothetical protein
MIDFEKLLYKKVHLWVVLLLIIFGLIVLSLYGSVVRHVAKGGILTGNIGVVADKIARYPGRIITLLNSYDVDPNPQIFQTNEKFVFKVEDEKLFRKNENDYLLVSTFNKNGSLINLYSLKQKKIVHTWIPPLDDIRKNSPDFIDGLNVTKFYRSQHPVLFENGDLAFSSGGGPLVKIDKCSKLVWAINEFFHHSNVLYENKIFSTITEDYYQPNVYLNDAISIIDPEKGKIIENIKIHEILSNFLAENLTILLGVGEFEKDLYHLNSVYPIKETDKFFKKDDLVVSLRNISTILVYRLSEKKIIWMKTGPWINNHDARYLGDGLFSIFSNNNVRGLEPNDFLLTKQSDIYIYDLNNDEYIKPYSKFLSDIKMRSSGLVNVLDVKNLDSVVQLNNYGKIIRLNDKKIIWTYQNYLGDNEKGNINWSKYIKKDEINLNFLNDKNC